MDEQRFVQAVFLGLLPDFDFDYGTRESFTRVYVSSEEGVAA
jgi:hypothetical protein